MTLIFSVPIKHVGDGNMPKVMSSLTIVTIRQCCIKKCISTNLNSEVELMRNTGKDTFSNETLKEKVFCYHIVNATSSHFSIDMPCFERNCAKTINKCMH
jgi:hypothetical protein